jgi:signal transduction histidine kinase
MQGAVGSDRRRRRSDPRGLHDPREFRGSKGIAATACLVVLGGAAIALNLPAGIHALGSVSSLVTVLIGIGIGIAIAIALTVVLGTKGWRAWLRYQDDLHRSIAEAATTRERKRIARDLHDGLAQDLAFIAAHGDRLAVEKGAEDPLAIAARRALAVSRGAIAELSGTQARTTADALRQVGDELSRRFGIEVDVEADPRASIAVKPSDREDIVRIAREAIVNAARHGRARRVVVSLLALEHQLVLRVRDDGVGMGAAPARSGGGFGLVCMRERAAALGGRLTAETPRHGGTEVELVVPSSAPVSRSGRRAA